MNAAALALIAALAAPATGPLSVDVAANRSSVQPGDTVNLTIVVHDDADATPGSAQVRIDQRVPSSLRYVWGTDGAVVSNTAVHWVVPIGPAHSGSVSATYTVTSDALRGELKATTTACTVQDGDGDGDGSAPACQTTSLDIMDSPASTHQSSLIGRTSGWAVVLVACTGAVVWAGGRFRRRHLPERGRGR